MDKVYCLKRCGSYIAGHGSYLHDWRDDDDGRAVFEQLLIVSADTVRLIIAEAMAGINVDEMSDLMADQARREYAVRMETAHPNGPQSWMRPANKEFVLFRRDDKYVYGVYVHDFKNYIIRAEPQRITRFCGPRGTYSARMRLALRGEFTTNPQDIGFGKGDTDNASP